MAKNGKGGLGRGLNALLSGSFESNTPATPSPVKNRVTIDGEVSTESIPSTSVSTSDIQSEPSKPENFSIPVPTVFQASEQQLEGNVVIPEGVQEVLLERISPNPDQPRTNFIESEIRELADSIDRDGLLQPIVVRELANSRYQIIAGERRWQACKKIGLKTVPIIIREADDDRVLELALIENIQRSDLNPIEEAYGYKRLMEHRGLTQSEIAQLMSKGRSTIANSLRLLELPEAAQELLFDNKISAGHARAILSIPTKEGRETLTKKLSEEKLSVRETENLAKLLAGRPVSNTAKRIPLPSAYKKVAKSLRDSLGTNVRVKSNKGKNKIEIEFKDEEELKRLFEAIIGE